ncbi:penicillin-binding protein 2 [Massilia sp. P8910]|uniref:peptidoglycan D,D-transpeptidase FtsI family protein n=1 Tax=Massilia antarctica TaxID=2765360 RepID=UPI0006BB9509|nr:MULTISPECIES: penicillin-binding protein 2 [Massilia]MCE3603396.1 penicillin-binding protein 2 [Massilia antarctica]MCY0912966.1 penicillin-binding protein 2 [Massilia sp. H27-R4]CUI07546.1 Cell division protein FtsI [Peptidoglycan synthetase] [Janthinobacterium sp. CG23_2]CUU31332.1 Cell division protein FtsI [Peptidoglycan synthetase] [Janthinobacterium sp. CG23_2]
MKRGGNGAAGARVAASKGVSFSKSPVLAVSLPTWRSRVVLFVLFASFVALAGRAMWLQTVTEDFLQGQGKNRYERTIELPATRGRILDRNGQVLASSVPVKAVWAIPEDVLESPPDKLRALAALLKMSEAELRKKLDSDRTFVYLKRQVDMPVIDQIAKLGIKGLDTRKEYKRYYPQGEIVTHLVGFTNVEDVGQESMELAQQKTLVGTTGSRRVIKDRLGQIVEDVGLSKEPHDGRDLTLSVDSKLQYIAYSQVKEAVAKFKAKAGAAVVLDVKTGEVLALANWPTYDPNDRKGLTGAQLRNRVITDTFEPGSTLKPFTVALALDSGRVTPNTRIDTGAGRFVINGAPISDTKAHGVITVAEIVEMSSNIGTSKLALSMPAREMWEMFTEVGFGQQPKFGFPGAVAGRVRPYKSWRPVEQATMSYGNGISVSLLQLARGYMMFARDGDTIPLSFQKVTEPPVGRQIIKPKTARDMREMLERVVSGEHGTAKLAQVPGYRVGGKTGTAYKVENGKYAMPRKYVGSFVGMVPMSNPRFIIAVMIDEPTTIAHFGGTVAAPTFAALAANALRALNIPPDSDVTEIVAPNDGSGEVM